MTATLINAPLAVESVLPIEWDNECADMMDEELSAASSEEASKVFEQWQADDEDDDVEQARRQDQDLADIMDVDEQIGSALLEVFHDPCVSPTGPLEELACLQMDEDDVDRFSMSLLSVTDDELLGKSQPLMPAGFDERYNATLAKLSESMKKSQQTRKSLVMQTPKVTEEYSRRSSVCGVLTSIEKSSSQLQGYLKNLQRV